MMIDSSIRKRWGLAPNTLTVHDEKDTMAESDFTASTAANVELRSRFRVSAQEWLPTWRILE